MVFSKRMNVEKSQTTPADASRRSFPLERESATVGLEYLAVYSVDVLFLTSSEALQVMV
jgi:hypothetical protein